MTFLDDPNYLLSQIRNSFLTSDDTGICEMIMINEDYLTKKLMQSSIHPSWLLDSNDSGLESDDNELSLSYDIASDMDYSLRRRSNTAQRLERLKKDRKKQAKFVVHWKDPEPFSAAEMEQAFTKKQERCLVKPVKSLLSEQLEKIPTLPSNPFSEYAKFDGNTYSGSATKTIYIYLTMLHSEDRGFPMTVITVATARVQELIGLICWQYTFLNKEPKLKENVDCYSLHIAEDDGEVDHDFPSLDTKEVISKFGFTTLALVEKDVTECATDNHIVVTVNIPQVGFSKIPVPNLDITLQEVLESTLRRRKGMSKAKGLEYHFEKQSKPGIPLDLETTLSSQDTLEFCLVRANSKRGTDATEEWEVMSKNVNVMEAPLFQLYKVMLTHPLYNTEIHLGISGEKIELLPAKKKNSAKFWSRKKAFSHDIDTIASCEILDLKYAGKSTFRLIYKNQNSHDFKSHDFEAETPVVQDVFQKISHIIEFRSSAVRRDYLLMKEKKIKHSVK